MNNNQDIHKMKLHESITVQTSPDSTTVVYRVPGGWIYKFEIKEYKFYKTEYVPYSSEFEEM